MHLFLVLSCVLIVSVRSNHESEPSFSLQNLPFCESYRPIASINEQNADEKALKSDISKSLEAKKSEFGEPFLVLLADTFVPLNSTVSPAYYVDSLQQVFTAKCSNVGKLSVFKQTDSLFCTKDLVVCRSSR